jgi:transcriptional regulator with XRE-family HTH domain
MVTHSLAKRLKELRTQRGMSQEFLAEESRVSLRTIQRIENEESKPTGETIKRLSVALDVAMNELVDSKQKHETSDINASLILLKQLRSRTTKKSEIGTFKKFIDLLTNLKKKDLTPEQLNAIESYIQYLELEKIPSFSNELFKQKLSKFKKYLKTKLRFVPNRYYTNIGIGFAISFGIGIVATNGIGIEIILLGLFIITACILMDLRMKKQGRSLDF